MRHSLSVVLIGLIVSPAALAQTETQAPSAAACALRQPEAPRPRGLGTVMGIQDAAVARANIPAREAQRGGAIDRRYLNDLRAVVKQDNGIIDIFDVPSGMTVQAGDRVRLQGSYRSTAFTCSYIPHMAIPNDAPAA
jgi:hypothetical protein